jgi:hypothetical protein
LKYLIILLVLGFLLALLYLRLRPYINTARRIFGFVREAQRLNVNRSTATPPQRAAAKQEQLLRCAACGAWLPASRALVLHATNSTYCSPACLEHAAGQTERRKTANGNS